MFTFGVSYFLCLNFLCMFMGVFVGVGVFMRARCVCCSLCASVYSLYMLLIVYVHCAFSLYIYLGEWGNGLLNGLIGGNGECKRLCNGAIWQLLKWLLHF